MATEYIEKAELMSLIESEAHRWGDDYDWWQCLADIEDFKPADVRPVVRGLWIWEEDAWQYRCSVCRKTFDYNETCGVFDYWSANYCPNCGADMRYGDAE